MSNRGATGACRTPAGPLRGSGRDRRAGGGPVAIACTSALLLAGLGAGPATDGPRDAGGADGASDPARQQRLRRVWDRYWPQFAARYVRVGERYYAFPGFDAKYASSAHLTSEAFQAEHLTTVRYRSRRTSYVRQVAPPPDDAQLAAAVLPLFEVGHYGVIHSCEVGRVLGPEQMIVRHIWLVDASAVQHERERERQRVHRATRWHHQATERIVNIRFRARNRLMRMQRNASERVRMHLIGYPTKDLAEGVRWSGPDKRGVHVAIVGISDIEIDEQVRHILMAVPAARLKQRLSELEFRRAAADRGFTIERFADLVLTARRSDLKRFEQHVLATLEGKAP